MAVSALLGLLVLLVLHCRAELEFAVHVRRGGGAQAADRLAARHGMENRGEVRAA
jgi:hypothetical protein